MQTRFSQWYASWQQLALREKQALILGTAFVLFALFYFLFWTPLNAVNDSLRTMVAGKQKTLSYMQSADQALKHLSQPAAQTSVPMTPILLMSEMQKRIKQAGLNDNLLEMKQTNNNGVTLRFQNINFETFAEFLIASLKSLPITIASFTANKTKVIGSADIEITFILAKS